MICDEHLLSFQFLPMNNGHLNLNTRQVLRLISLTDWHWLTCTDGHRGAPLSLPALEGGAAQQAVAGAAAQSSCPAPAVSRPSDLAVLQTRNQAVLCNRRSNCMRNRISQQVRFQLKFRIRKCQTKSKMSGFCSQLCKFSISTEI